MTKKDIKEIKKALGHKAGAVTRIRICYVNGNRDVIMEAEKNSSLMPREEYEQFCAVFQKTLSGKQGKNLFDIPVRTREQEELRDLLLAVTKGKAGKEKEDELMGRIAMGYDDQEGFVVIMGFGGYDVPGISGRDSDCYHSFMVCCICKLRQEAPGLLYDGKKNDIHDRLRGWEVKMPDAAFMFPSFTDHQTDVNAMTYYARQPKERHEEFVETVLQGSLPDEAGEQTANFVQAVEEGLGRDAVIENIVKINRSAQAFAVAAEDAGEEAVIGQKEMGLLLQQAGGNFKNKDDNFYATAGNVASPSYTFSADGVKVTASEDVIDRFQQRIVDGRLCLVIPMESMTLNGIRLQGGGK